MHAWCFGERKAENAANLGLRSRSLLVYSIMTSSSLPSFRLFDFVNRLKRKPDYRLPSIHHLIFFGRFHDQIAHLRTFRDIALDLHLSVDEETVSTCGADGHVIKVIDGSADRRITAFIAVRI